MEKEFVIDQEDVAVIPIENNQKESEEMNYSDFSQDDFATADENDIDWSTL